MSFFRVFLFSFSISFCLPRSLPIQPIACTKVLIQVLGLRKQKTQTNSADAVIDSQATGAMSHAFISALRDDPDQSYLELLNKVRDILETNYSQKPQLSCSHPLGTSSPLIPSSQIFTLS